MSEKIISTIDAIQKSNANRTPEQKVEMLEDGINALTGEQLKANREFYGRMIGLTALRSTIESPNSDEIYANARQLYGPLGYDSTPRQIRKL
ncbi:MAG: hypothetical protein ABIR91_05790 [Candidatus Saccharimonadales bacterium]